MIQSNNTLISFVQVNFSVGPKEKNAYYLPYSVGVIWEYAKFKGIESKFQLGDVVWKRDPIDEVAKKLSKSFIVAFSNYIWNKSYNYQLAIKIKEINPSVLIIFGGPETPISKNDFFQIYPFIDVVIKKEGEIVFFNLLDNINMFPDIKEPGLLINHNGKLIDTGESSRIDDLDSIPSPYLSGFFKDIMDTNPNIEWNMTLETDRGCPYACTFCDWGSLTYNKVRKFKLDRVYSELEWAGKNKIGFMSMTNANFGIFIERDNLIVDKILEVQNKYGYPYTFSTAWAKNQKREVISLVKKLIDSKTSFNQGLTVSVQSMDDNVLKIIKRKNMEISNISDVFKECEVQNVPVYTELILGLPGETLETWKNNFYELFHLGNHSGITVFQAQLLENAEMNLFQRKLYEIKSSTVYDYMEGNINDGDIKEGVDIIISTKNMPYEDMKKAQIWSWFITSFHINGLSSYIARVLNKLHNIPYSVFYEKLFIYVKNDNWWNYELTQTEHYFDQWMTCGEVDHPPIEGVKILGWNLIYRSTANIMIDNKYDHTFSMLRKFIESEFNVTGEFLDELIDFQNNYFVRYDNLNMYPIYKFYNNDYITYLQSSGNLNNSVKVKFDFLDDKNMSRSEYIKYLYFYRRRNFGKTWMSIAN